jgi:hypothetical protein
MPFPLATKADRKPKDHLPLVLTPISREVDYSDQAQTNPEPRTTIELGDDACYGAFARAAACQQITNALRKKDPQFVHCAFKTLVLIKHRSDIA